MPLTHRSRTPETCEEVSDDSESRYVCIQYLPLFTIAIVNIQILLIANLAGFSSFEKWEEKSSKFLN